MTERARREYALALQARYAAADKRGRGQILDEYCRTTGCHRKAAIRRLRKSAPASARPPGRPQRYGPELVPVLARVWEASDYLCGKLLAPMRATLLTALERHHALALRSPIRAALLAASPATLDRLLRPLRRRRARQPRRLAPALTTIRAQVPLRTWSEWTGVAPGAVQGDLVLHCGDTTAGFYLTTLVAVDVATTWTELQAVWGLHYYRVQSAVQHVGTRFPFALREWHSDNGSEFLNEHLLAWCRRRRIRFTRGRPYRKNDQAWVEQRNGLVVRRLIGYDRYSTRAAFSVLQRLYGLLRLQLNFFRPVRKLVSKERASRRHIHSEFAQKIPGEGSPDRITVNLAPADIRKEGASFDLPIALGILTATGAVNGNRPEPCAVVGELALDGQIQPVPGVLAVGLACRRRGVRTLLVPSANRLEADMVSGLTVLAADTLREAVGLLNGEAPSPRPPEDLPAGHWFGSRTGPERFGLAILLRAVVRWRLEPDPWL